MIDAPPTSSRGVATAPSAHWRFRAGTAIFVLGFCAPLAIPVVTFSGLPTAWKTAISGALAVGVPEIMMVAAAAVMGREGFAKLKQLWGRILRKYGPSEQVSRARYRTGLVMFALPLLVGWLGPYLHHHLPGFDRHPVFWHIGGDLAFALSFFVLGGEFWDKVRSLFVHGARAVFPSEDGKGGRDEG